MVEALTAAIAAGDRDGVVAALRGRSEAERKRAAPAFLPDAPHQRVEGDEEELMNLVVIGTATLKQMRVVHEVTWADEDAIAAVLLDRRPPWLADWAQWALTLEFWPQPWFAVRDLVRAGAIERPAAYIPALVSLGPEAVPDEDLWAVFEHGASWLDQLADRADDRDRLLDLTLNRLNGDLNAHRSGWYTKLWRAAKVTREERATRVDDLRSLLGAAARPVVSFAVAELAKPGGSVPPEELAPALASTAKSTVRTALKLLGEHPELAVLALAHPDPELQGEVLDRLERWELDDAARDTLAQHLELLAATQRPRAEALLGVRAVTTPDAPTVDLDAIPQAIREALNFGGPLPPAPIPGEPVLGERIEPLESFDELVAALRVETWPLDERVLDAILRRCDEDCTLPDMDWGGAAHYVVQAWAQRDAGEREDTLLSEARARAAAGHAGPLLSLPTHAGGWIDPRRLVERVHPHVGPRELRAALLRLAPDHRPEALEAARELPGRTGFLIRCALGGDDIENDGPDADAARAVAGLVPLDDALGRELHPGQPPDHARFIVDGEFDETAFAAAFLAADPSQPRRFPYDPRAFPSHRELAAAHWLHSARGGSPNDELLEVLVREGEPLAPLTLRYVVLALGATDARAHLLAVDVITAAIEDGRIDALPTEDVADIKPNRLAARLTTVAEAGPLHRAVVRAFLDRIERRARPLRVLYDELCAARSTEETQFALAARARRAYRWMSA